MCVRFECESCALRKSKTKLGAPSALPGYFFQWCPTWQNAFLPHLLMNLATADIVKLRLHINPLLLSICIMGSMKLLMMSTCIGMCPHTRTPARVCVCVCIPADEAIGRATQTKAHEHACLRVRFLRTACLTYVCVCVCNHTHS